MTRARRGRRRSCPRRASPVSRAWRSNTRNRSAPRPRRRHRPQWTEVGAVRVMADRGAASPRSPDSPGGPKTAVSARARWAASRRPPRRPRRPRRATILRKRIISRHSQSSLLSDPSHRSSGARRCSGSGNVAAAHTLGAELVGMTRPEDESARTRCPQSGCPPWRTTSLGLLPANRPRVAGAWRRPTWSNPGSIRDDRAR